MYKVIANEEALTKWEREEGQEFPLYNSPLALRQLKEIIRQLDVNYGADRDLEKDLGGYTIVISGEPKEIRDKLKHALRYHHLDEDMYEFEDRYMSEDGENRVLIRLYLCSCDYCIVVVLVNF